VEPDVTGTDADPGTAPTVIEVALPEAAGTVARRGRRHRALVLIAVLAVVLVAVAFEGPLAHIWYQSRQDNLASDLNAKRPHTAKGQALGVLQIPKIGLNLVVVEGDGPAQLRGGPGHRIGTARPGEVGNSLISGHRNGWGASFGALANLQAGDRVYVQLHGAEQPTLFVVQSVDRVRTSDRRLLGPSDDHRLTLVTAAGGQWFPPGHLVVTAVSGVVGHQVAGRAPPAESPGGSDVVNLTVLLFVLLGLATTAAVKVMRRVHRAAATAVVVGPLALGALLALMLALDQGVFRSLR